MRILNSVGLATTALAAVLALTLPAAAQTAAPPFALEPTSRLWLAGNTNVHGWTCRARSLKGAIDVGDPASSMIPQAEGAAFGADSLKVGFPITLLDCGLGAMTHSLRSALKAGRYPDILFTLANSSVTSLGQDSLLVVARGRLSMAGQTRPVVVKARVTRLANGRLRVVGQKALSMTAFGVTPPTAMLGIIRADDRVVVHFDIVVQSTTTLIASSGHNR